MEFSICEFLNKIWIFAQRKNSKKFGFQVQIESQGKLNLWKNEDGAEESYLNMWIWD